MPPKPARLAPPTVPKRNKKSLPALMAHPPPSTIVHSGSTYRGETFVKQRIKGSGTAKLRPVSEDATTSVLVQRHKPQLRGASILPWVLAVVGLAGAAGLGMYARSLGKRLEAAENESKPEVIAARVALEVRSMQDRLLAASSDRSSVASGASEHKEGEEDDVPSLEAVDALAETLSS